MRNSHAAEHISHSPDARSATPLLDPGDPGTRGRAQKDLSTDTGGRMRDDGGDGGGVGYAAAAAARRHQLRSRSPGGITRFVCNTHFFTEPEKKNFGGEREGGRCRTQRC